MKKRLCGFLVFCFLAGGRAAGAAVTPYEKKKVEETIAAIESCYHWGGEVGDQSDKRNKEISEGVARDCPKAKTKATEAYARYPKNSVLAAGLIELIDVGYFIVSPAQKTQICETALPEFQKEFLTSKEEDPLYSGECPDTAGRLYKK